MIIANALGFNANKTRRKIMAYYLTNSWDDLTNEEQTSITKQARKAQDKANRTICLWCGEPLYNGECDYTGSYQHKREICKNYCKGVRYFDMPRQTNTPITHPLYANPSEFVGYEPVAVILDNESLPVTSWKEVYQTVLQYCIQDFACYERLVALKRSMSTHKQPLLSSKPDKMNCPVEICEDLYAEVDHSFHILLQNLTDRIFTPIEFNFYAIKIVVQ